MNEEVVVDVRWKQRRGEMIITIYVYLYIHGFIVIKQHLLLILCTQYILWNSDVYHEEYVFCVVCQECLFCVFCDNEWNVRKVKGLFLT